MKTATTTRIRSCCSDLRGAWKRSCIWKKINLLTHNSIIYLKQSENIMTRALARNYAVTQVSKDENLQIIVFTF